MDCRDREQMMGSWYECFDEKRMTLTIIQDNGEGEPVEVTLPAKYDVCGLCNGKGSHTNPSIDAHGISAEEFDEDPDFRESYMSGTYDVLCYRCKGNRVEPAFDRTQATPEQKKMVDDLLESRYHDALERENEMRYGY